MNQTCKLATLLVVLACCWAGGCGSRTPAAFRSRESVESLMTGSYSREAKARVGDAKGTAEETVLHYFGTPSALVAWEKMPLDYGEDGEILARGRQLYMAHCMHCHGTTGDGAGPTARYLTPRPRDYRLGLFKFTSTKGTLRARRDDLKRIVKQGIPGTYMPSFLLLVDDPEHPDVDELGPIITYVQFLAFRGQMENDLVTRLTVDYSQAAYDEASEEEKKELLKQFEEFLKSDDEFDGWTAFLNDTGTAIRDGWTLAAEDASEVVPTVPRPEATPESIEAGRQIFIGAKAKCNNCHGNGARGDGPQTLAFQLNKATNKNYKDPGLHDDWGNPISPRNLTLGVYRGGRRPLDLFRRVYAGVKGTPMAGFSGSLKDEDIWNVVNYVMSLPYETPESDERHRSGATTKTVRNESPSNSEGS